MGPRFKSEKWLKNKVVPRFLAGNLYRATMVTMETLILAQTLFYFSVSFVIIVCGLLVIALVLQINFIVRHLKNVSSDIDDASFEIKDKLQNIIDRLEDFPFLSYFLRKRIVRNRADSGARHKRS